MYNNYMNRQKGQIILVLILVMTVALAIGISVVQRSLSDISTASKVEQSSRAFSAAEAGIEKALKVDSAITTQQTLDNNSLIQGVDRKAIPLTGQALEYPPLSKEETAHVWLANPDTLAQSYSASTLDVYWGSSQSSGREVPALEVRVIWGNSSAGYQAQSFYIDPVSGTEGQASNNFLSPSQYSGGCTSIPPINTSLSVDNTTNDRLFKCKVTLSIPNVPSIPAILLRARFLYNSTSQPFAVKPTSGSLPEQGRLFTSTGVSGQTQRKVQLFQINKVVPPYFDYAIFSTGDITK